MISLENIVLDPPDSLNPLLVREIRQSMRGKVFGFIIGATSVLSMIIVICGILATSNATSISLEFYRRNSLSETGLGMFCIMMAILCLLGLVILPVAAAFRFNDERKGGEFNLLIVTGITPKKIVIGKMQASFIQMFLIVSVAAPFMVVCYLLRGVSIITILLSILGLLLISLAFMQSALFLGALKIPKFLLAILFFSAAWGILNIVAPIFLLIGMLFGMFLNYYLVFLMVTFMFAGACIAFFFPMTLLVLRAHRNRYTPYSLKERGLDVAWIDQKAYLINNKEDRNE